MRSSILDEAALRRRLAMPLAAARDPATPTDHPDLELLVAHAANELGAEHAAALTRHLALCEDGSCAAVLREAVAGAAVARDLLFGRDDATDPASSVPSEPRADRSFTCPEALWDAFESLAKHEGTSVDGLLADAMKAYMRDRMGRPRTPLDAVRVTLRESQHGPPRERNTPTLPRAYLPRPPPSSRRNHPQGSLGRPHVTPPAPALAVVMAGVRYEVTKDRFVVGRGGPASDLAIDDPGVSRQHAVIERDPAGGYSLVDMGSTNGVEFQGERIARKAISHGDRFRIGELELEFVFG
jgi:hypothetical protein